MISARFESGPSAPVDDHAAEPCPADDGPRPDRVVAAHSDRPGARLAFTVIELLIAIAIIAILAALLLPAVNAALFGGRQTQAIAEITAMEKALIDFKSEYGVYPPSQISLHDDLGSYFSPTNPLGLMGTNLRNRDASLRAIRRVWPAFDAASIPTLDFNNDGDADDIDDIVDLSGAEALVFFLGGMRESYAPSGTGLGFTPIGFGVVPSTPFTQTLTGNRKQFFEFNPEQLIDADGDNLPEYRDPLTDDGRVPYVYFSAYEGAGYVPTENITATYAVLPYYRGLSGGVPVLPYNDETFQIISPGADQDFGDGGVYSPEGGLQSPDALDDANSRATNATEAEKRQRAEQDNLVNFGNFVLSN